MGGKSVLGTLIRSLSVWQISRVDFSWTNQVIIIVPSMHSTSIDIFMAQYCGKCIHGMLFFLFIFRDQNCSSQRQYNPAICYNSPQPV